MSNKMVEDFNGFNNISAISWRPIQSVGIQEYWQTITYCFQVHLDMGEIKLAILGHVPWFILFLCLVKVV